MLKTRVVNRREAKFDVFIGRGSMWGNPFVMNRDGNREQVIEKYKEWVITNPAIMACLGDLRGKVLGCYCKPKPCHGDVLVALIGEGL